MVGGVAADAACPCGQKVYVAAVAAAAETAHSAMLGALANRVRAGTSGHTMVCVLGGGLRGLGPVAGE